MTQSTSPLMTAGIRLSQSSLTIWTFWPSASPIFLAIMTS